MAPSTSRASSVDRTTSSCAIFAAAALACVGAATALPFAARAQEVVQRLPTAEEGALTEALQVLARNPENERALLIAGRSTLLLGDIDAALGFFSRARDANPGSAEALAGIAAVQVRRGDPVNAIALFDNVGEDALRDPAIAAERALAYDLVGAQTRAQQLYRDAIQRATSDELVRRLSLSQAIAGDREGSEATLLPLLQRQNKQAWRTRAFALAILGASDEAVTVANAVMPAGLAREMEPFLRIMVRLTRAQQAAAANLGKFPATEEIGRDTPQIAGYGAAAPPPTARRSAGSGLVPQGQPLGQPSAQQPTQQSAQLPARKPREVGGERLARQGTTLRDQAAQRGREQAPAQVAVQTPPPAASLRAEAPTVSEPVVQPATPSTEPAGPQQGPAFQGTPPSRPGFDLSQVPSEPQDEPEPPVRSEPDFASVFGDIAKPDADADATSGAVDVTGITPAKPKPRPKPVREDPPPPPHPARIWIQLGVGRDVEALAFDWRRLKRRYEILDGRDAYRAPLGQTNRMITGPFASRKEALALVNALKKEGHESLVWRSGEGEEVMLLPGS